MVPRSLHREPHGDRQLTARCAARRTNSSLPHICSKTGGGNNMSVLVCQPPHYAKCDSLQPFQKPMSATSMSGHIRRTTRVCETQEP